MSLTTVGISGTSVVRILLWQFLDDENPWDTVGSDWHRANQEYTLRSPFGSVELNSNHVTTSAKVRVKNIRVHTGSPNLPTGLTFSTKILEILPHTPTLLTARNLNLQLKFAYRIQVEAAVTEGTKTETLHSEPSSTEYTNKIKEKAQLLRSQYQMSHW